MHNMKKRIGVKQWALLLAIVAVLAIGVGSVYAYIITRTPEVENQFVPVQVSCDVKETFVNGLKKDVSIVNTSDVPCYIRAMVVINWVDADKNVLPVTPVKDVDYLVEWGTENWAIGSDGFWYYTKAVDSKEETELLIKTMNSPTTDEERHLYVQILASAIQAQPDEAVKTAWKANVSGDVLIAP